MNKEYFKQRAIAKKCLLPILVENDLTRQSGIYLYERTDEEGITYFYCGQAVNIYNRQIDHWCGYQHIDRSLHARKFYSDTNPYGWKFSILEVCEPDNLNERERYYILKFMKQGWQSYNMNYGGAAGKGQTKETIRKGYAEGKKLGYEKARADVRTYFEKYLTCSTKTTKVIDLKKLQEFTEWLKGEES